MSQEAKTLATIVRHCQFVREGIGLIVDELERRGLVHDASKLLMDEFEGFARINANARDHAYGSEEYREGMRLERPTIELHNIRNSHHPEHHEPIESMGLFDIIEMVCDWRGASLGYGNTSFRDALPMQWERFGFTEEQWWVVEQLADFLDPPAPPPTEGDR